MTEGKQAVEEAKDFLEKASKCPTCGRKHGEFSISRIPNKTKEYFKKLADEEFCSDYGMTLKYLCDLQSGLLPNGNELAELADAKAEEALSQITELRAMVEKPQKEKKVIRMCDGKEKVI